MKFLNKRNMLFISHAWEDFEFTKWLALKLANEGYGVWCDLTKLLGGENWPKEINQALQNRTCKFLFVLSKSSNTKPDPLGELETARKVMKRENVQDFILPLKIDDISRDEVDYRLQEIQTFSFETGKWGNGLADLLSKLQDDKISKHDAFNPEAVNDWWKKYGTDANKILSQPENLSSNRFEIVEFPKTLFAHFVEDKPNLTGYIKFPLVPYKEYILSFASQDNLLKESGVQSKILESIAFSTIDILEGNDELIKDSKNGIYYFTRLMNQAFEKGLKNKEIKFFKLSKGLCYYFDETQLPGGRIIYTNKGELNSRIKLWGKYRSERWHWGIRAKFSVEPILHFLVQPHILIRNNNVVSAAPKGVYKSWRNDKWRDKLRASLLHLSADNNIITFDLCSDELLKVSCESIKYYSTYTYEEPTEQLEIDEEDIEE